MIICVDFDGVIHSYTSGWKGADVITDSPVVGAFEWLENLISEGLEVCIYSSRSGQEGGIDAMKLWFDKHGFVNLHKLKFPSQKPPAFMTVDDRAFCFRGRFPTVDWLRNFKPWYK